MTILQELSGDLHTGTAEVLRIQSGSKQPHQLDPPRTVKVAWRDMTSSEIYQSGKNSGVKNRLFYADLIDGQPPVSGSDYLRVNGEVWNLSPPVEFPPEVAGVSIEGEVVS